MKILVSTEKRRLEHNLNGLEFFTLYTVITGSVVDKSFLRVGFRNELPSYLKQNRVDVLICRDIEAGVATALQNQNVEVLASVGETPDEEVTRYLASELDDIGTHQSSAAQCTGMCDTCAHPCH